MIDYILKRTGIKNVLYKARRRALTKKVGGGYTVDEAFKCLHEYYPDNGGSCICPKKLGDKYDLEIIIPAYNVEKYLERCLDSVVNQKTSYSFHVTCIDDGSTDLTGVIADKYVTFDNVTVIHQKNRG